VDVHTAAPTDGQVLAYVSGNTRYEPSTVVGSGSGSVVVSVTNKSGGTLTQGQAVIWDATTADSVTTTTTANAIPIAGVIYSASIANDASGDLLVLGRIETEVVGTPAKQTVVGLSSTPGKVEATSPGPEAVVGTVVGNVSSGKVPLFVNHLG